MKSSSDAGVTYSVYIMGGIKITLSNNCCGQLTWNKNVVINVFIVNYFSSLVIIKLEAKMIKTITMFMIITILIAGCDSTTEADTESAEWKTFSNDQYGYSFEVPAFCFEGPLPGECKQSPPEERAEECLCFVDGTNPDSVTFQNITITNEGFPMASISITSPDTPAYSPAEGADLVSFIQQEWSWMDLEELPDEPNLDLDGLPAISMAYVGSQGGASAQEIFFIKENKLFIISMATNPNKTMAFYEHFLESFAFSD